MTPNDPVPPAADAATSGRFAYEGLERVFHEKARLSIMTSLVAHPRGLVFADLKEFCALTDGNLSRHLQVLSESGFVALVKGYQHNRPQTLCLLTDEGRRRFLDYINVLESVVADALTASNTRADPQAKPKQGKAIAEGWSPA
jgi:DNA-binding MarR family transcriptional regulator